MQRLLALTVVCLGAFAGNTVLALPQGYTTFFNGQTCPGRLVDTAVMLVSLLLFFGGYRIPNIFCCADGWDEIPDAKGRLVVAVTDSELAGLTLNDPLKNQEDRTHTHT